MDAQNPETGSHHQRIGFADKICLLAGGHFNRRDQSPACRNDSQIGGAGHIRIGSDKASALPHQRNRLADRLIVIILYLAHNHIIRIAVGDGNAAFVERSHQSRFADDVGGAVFHLLADKSGGCKCAGIEMFLVDVQPHSGKLHLEFQRRFAAGVGQKKVFLVLSLKPFHELLYARKQHISVIDNAVHVAYESFFVFQLFHFFSFPVDDSTTK